MWRSGGQRAGRIRRPHAVGLVPLCPPCCGGTCRGSRGRATVWGRSAGARLRAARPPQHTPLSRALAARLSCPHTCPLPCLTLVRTSPSGIMAAQTAGNCAGHFGERDTKCRARPKSAEHRGHRPRQTALPSTPPLFLSFPLFFPSLGTG